MKLLKMKIQIIIKDYVLQVEMQVIVHIHLNVKKITPLSQMIIIEMNKN